MQASTPAELWRRPVEQSATGPGRGLVHGAGIAVASRAVGGRRQRVAAGHVAGGREG